MGDNDSKRSQVKEITDRLAEGVKELFASDQFAAYLRTMSRFYKYSTRNTVLIHLQNPEASLVAGYQAWQTKFGRYVKKDEKGIKILAPVPFTVKEEQQKKRRGMSRYLLSVIVQVRHNDFDVTVPAKIVFIRDKNNRKKWIALISTDVSLSEDEIVALYGKRWDIETFHKIIKSYLGLAKEFQMRSFDALAAHTALVMVRYIFLSLENRENKDERSLGELFLAVCDELDDISFQYAFGLIITVLDLCLRDYLHLAAGRIDSFVQQFITALPGYIKDRLCFGVCES